jgi:hypothetical protein
VSYAVPASPGPKVRPAVVTAAGYLLFLAAVVLIINGLLPLASLSKVVDATRKAYANSTNPTPDTVASFTQAFAIITVVVTILFGVLFFILGSLDLRGKQAGRILSWVFGGLGVLCAGCGLGSAGLSSRMTTNTNANGVDVKAATDQINAARPSWLTPVSTTLSVIILLSLIAVIVLLATPPSNAYFRKEQPAFDPAFPNMPYPPPPGSGPGSPGSSPYPGPGDAGPTPPSA